MAKITGGRALIDSLTAHGVDHVFGVVSTHNLDLYDALYDSQTTIKYIGNRLELGSAYMADGYARASGKPGVLLTSAGPGAADTMGAMGEAYHSGSPLLEITTNVEKDFINSRRGMIHEPKDQLEMFRSVTDWNAMIPDVESIPDYIQEAFQRFQTRRPRPIELEIPTDLLGQKADVEVTPPREVAQPPGDPAMIESAAEALVKSRRPVLLVGDEVNTCGGTEELIELSEALGAPVATCNGGNGAFPEDHPLFLGHTLGGRLMGANPIHELLTTCDLALVVGSNLPYRLTVNLGLPLPTNLVHILLDGTAIGRNYPVSIPIVAGPKAALQGIISQLNGRDVYKGGAFNREIGHWRDRTYQALKEIWPNELNTLEAMRSVIPRDAATCWGVTVPSDKAVRCFPTYRPRSFIQAHGWSGLGFGFPVSLGAKLARPQVPVVCVTGDGGFQYNMQELGTARQYGINPVVVMFNDSAWGVLKQFQEDRYGRTMGTELENPDFVKLFEAYGFEGTRVDTVDELANALGSAIASDRLELIEARIPNGFASFR